MTTLAVLTHQKASQIRRRRDAQDDRLRIVRKLVVLRAEPVTRHLSTPSAFRSASVAAYQCGAERDGGMECGVMRAHVEHEVLRKPQSSAAAQSHFQSRVRTCVNFDLYVCNRLEWNARSSTCTRYATSPAAKRLRTT